MANGQQNAKWTSNLDFVYFRMRAESPRSVHDGRGLKKRAAASMATALKTYGQIT